MHCKIETLHLFTLHFSHFCLQLTSTFYIMGDTIKSNTVEKCF